MIINAMRDDKLPVYATGERARLDPRGRPLRRDRRRLFEANPRRLQFRRRQRDTNIDGEDDFEKLGKPESLVTFVTTDSVPTIAVTQSIPLPSAS